MIKHSPECSTIVLQQITIILEPILQESKLHIKLMASEEYMIIKTQEKTVKNEENQSSQQNSKYSKAGTFLSYNLVFG